MTNIQINDLKSKIKDFVEFYGIEKIDNEIELWHELWNNKDVDKAEFKDLEICDVLKEADDFFHELNLHCSYRSHSHVLLAL